MSGRRQISPTGSAEAVACFGADVFAVGASFERHFDRAIVFDRGFHRAVGGHEDDHGLGPDLLDLGEQLDAVHTGHAEIGEHYVRLFLLE